MHRGTRSFKPYDLRSATKFADNLKPEIDLSYYNVGLRRRGVGDVIIHNLEFVSRQIDGMTLIPAIQEIFARFQSKPHIRLLPWRGKAKPRIVQGTFWKINATPHGG
jgi:hypothetical protein